MKSTDSIGMFWAMLHKIHCIQRDALGLAEWTPLHTIGIHCAKMQGILCIQWRCMESTAFNRDAFYHAAWITLHSITMHGIHGIQLGSIAPQCMESSAFNDAAWNPLHSFGMLWAMLYKIHCINHAAWNLLHSIMLHNIHCIQ